jgi:hypothetical protein
VQEVPAPLRSRLIKSTNGVNSATILIADRRGRQEIARAMRSLPNHMQRRLMQAVLGSAAEQTAKLPMVHTRRAAIAALLLLAVAAVIWLVSIYR